MKLTKAMFLLSCVLLAGDLAFASQTATHTGNDPSPDQANIEPPAVKLTFSPTKSPSNLPSSPVIINPILCNSGGTIFLQMLQPPEFRQRIIYAVTKEKVQEFVAGSITSLQSVEVESIYPSDSQLAMLVQAKDGTSHDETRRSRYYPYIAVFDLAGKFKHAIPLPETYSVSHIAVLDDDRYLVIAYDHSSGVARLELWNGDGEKVKTFDLPANRSGSAVDGDAGSREESISSSRLLGEVNFTPYKDSVLVWRARSSDPILEISTGGSVREVPLQIPKGYVLADIVPANDRWVVHFRKTAIDSTKPSNLSDPVAYSYYDVRPSDGSLARRLNISGDTGIIACESDGIYRSFKLDAQSKYVLLSTQ